MVNNSVQYKIQVAFLSPRQLLSYINFGGCLPIRSFCQIDIASVYQSRDRSNTGF